MARLGFVTFLQIFACTLVINDVSRKLVYTFGSRALRLILYSRPYDRHKQSFPDNAGQFLTRPHRKCEWRKTLI